MPHAALLAAYFTYGLFWLWHEPMLGLFHAVDSYRADHSDIARRVARAETELRRGT